MFLILTFDFEYATFLNTLAVDIIVTLQYL